MATVTTNPDNSLTLVLNEEERTTFDGSRQEFEGFITLWLEERFKTVWEAKVNRLTLQQKRILAGYLKDVADIKPDKP